MQIVLVPNIYRDVDGLSKVSSLRYDLIKMENLRIVKCVQNIPSRRAQVEVPLDIVVELCMEGPTMFSFCSNAYIDDRKLDFIRFIVFHLMSVLHIF